MGLFQKSYEELREAFVLARFAEQQIFGRADIDQWLTQQRELERPDDAWEQLLSTVTMIRSAQRWADTDWFDLRSHATSLGILNAQFGSIGRANDYGPIYDRLAFVPRGLDPLRGLYSGIYDMLYVENHIDGPMFVIYESGRRKETNHVLISRIRDRHDQLGAMAIVGVVFSEWHVHRPSWEAARHSICHLLVDAIDREREQAEKDFDTAIAVSQDGTELVHADYVAVAQHSGWQKAKVMIYPASAFKTKLLRSPDMERWPHTPEFDMPEQCMTDHIARIQHAIQHPPPLSVRGSLGYELDPHNHTREQGRIQRLLDYAMKGGKRYACLLTTKHFCPTPLPGGGIKITA